MRVAVDIWNRVETVLRGGIQLALATSGGGSELASWLLNHPGASGTIVEVQVPYRQEALEAYLGSSGPHRVEERTARDMAGRAFARAAFFTNNRAGVVGVGCTAALATSRARRGEDRVCIALRLEGEYRLYALRFEKGAAERVEQEEALSRFALEAIAEVCGGEPAGSSLPEYAQFTGRTVELEDPLGLLLEGELDVVEMDVDGALSPDVERGGRLLFPGSFNPLHQGHERLAAAAGRLSGRTPSLELSVENVDKSPLDKGQVRARLAQIQGRFAALITRAPTFVQKARLCSGCHFAIGYDTAVRILQGKYYDGGKAGMVQALDELVSTRCRFWVAGRLDGGSYRTLADIEVPGAYADLFAAIPEGEFRMDISSAELRSRTTGEHG